MPELPDLREISDEVLDEWLTAITAEIHRRQVLADVPVQVREIQERAESEIEDLASEYLVVRDGSADPSNPSEWVDPSSPGGMPYPKGWVAIFAGKMYVSGIPNNRRRPADEGDPQTGRWWALYDPDADPSVWTPWVAYEVGDERTFEGDWYSCRRAHTSQPDWTPPEVPNLWGAMVEEAPDPDPEPEPPAPEYPVWKPWDHISPLHKKGDRVTHKGRTWEAEVGDNHWEPGVYGWKDLGPAKANSPAQRR